MDDNDEEGSRRNQARPSKTKQGKEKQLQKQKQKQSGRARVRERKMLTDSASPFLSHTHANKHFLGLSLLFFRPGRGREKGRGITVLIRGECFCGCPRMRAPGQWLKVWNTRCFVDLGGTLYGVLVRRTSWES